MDNTEDLNVIIGKIGAPFGVKGWVKVHSFTDPVTNIILFLNDITRLKD